MFCFPAVETAGYFHPSRWAGLGFQDFYIPWLLLGRWWVLGLSDHGDNARSRAMSAIFGCLTNSAKTKRSENVGKSLSLDATHRLEFLKFSFNPRSLS
jgi:hypothetical protein